MFTSIEPVHLAILTHHLHSNIHNNIDNNNNSNNNDNNNNNSNNNNNTVSATHTQKKVYFFSTLQQKWALYAAILYPTLQAICAI